MRTFISIHAAREGGDPDKDEIVEAVEISIHAAREGGDEACMELAEAAFRFQSTPPVKAATAAAFILDAFRTISIHAAREGGDGGNV